jgi:rare lipoprotein A
MQLRIDLRHWQKYVATCLFSLLLAACGSVPKAPSSAADAAAGRPAASNGKNTARSSIPALPPAGSGRGGYYQDDGPGDAPPAGLEALPDAEPKIEPYSTRGNKPYTVFGTTYRPITDERPFKQRGVGSWYGKKFHGQKTSSGEPYDMYRMTAAHPTLPIPSYARVTNLNNGVQIIVRINDRGPFHSSRIIDLSYTAALKLGYLGKGSSQLEVERLLPDEIERIAAAKRNPPQQAQAAAPTLQVAPQNIDPAANAATVATPAPVQAGNPVAALPIALPAASQPQQEAAPPLIASAVDGVAANGFYLQLGAYAQANNAEAVRNRLSQQWANSLPPIEVVEYGLFYRLYSGPFANRTDAASAAQQMQDAGLSKPVIVQR